MAKTNRVRVGEMMDALKEGLGPYVLARFKARYRGKYLQEMELELYESNHPPQRLPNEKTALEQLDVQAWLNLMVRKWNEAFRDKLGQAERSYISELREARNKWAHQSTFDNDAAHRVADTATLLLQAVGADKQAELTNAHAQFLLRQRFERDAKKSVKRAAAPQEGQQTTAPGLQPWRLVIQPHSDVTSGHYTQAEFAADLAQVVQGKAEVEYGDAREFFRRTYLTQGLQDLLVTGFHRLAGQGGDPVVQLQTNFGGGKTHSMLALYHLFGGKVKIADVAGAEDIIKRIGDVDRGLIANRAVIVGTAFDANEPRIHDNCTTYTLWGEIAWQLGGLDAYELVANADTKRISPGSDTLLKLLEEHGPALIIMDELVAFARNLYGKGEKPSAGSFASVMTFMQSLTEAVKRSSDAMLLVSLPASETEIGGEGGREAMDAVAKTFGRIEAVWKPVSATESFEIVRRRLFDEVNDHAARDAVLSAYHNMYQKNQSDFPAEASESDYYQRMRQAYPIHPELFDRLYKDWSTLERFQRTRGVLRLMAEVIHQLWHDNNTDLMIMSASIPLWKKNVSAEMVKFLPQYEAWGPIVDTDIDGDRSEPAEIEREVPNLAKYYASRRVARTVFVGSAPSVAGQRVRGIEEVRIRLGTVQPGQSTASFNDALNRMSKRLSYLYSDGSRYWYDTRPTVNRLAQDKAQGIPDDDVWREAVRRLREETRWRDNFAAAHVVPETSGDILDEQRARVVVLDVDAPHHRQTGESEAQQAARDILDYRGSAPRLHRNMLVFIAADKTRAAEWKQAIRQNLAWKSIEDDREKLNLDFQQGKQVENAIEETEKTVMSRLNETYSWLLVPTRPDSRQPIRFEAYRMTGQENLYERAAQRLKNEELLLRRWSPDFLREALNTWLWREEAHLNLKQLWEDFTRYCYLQRLYDENVLLDAIVEGVRDIDPPFGYARGIKEDGSYSGLAMQQATEPYFDGSDLIVKPDVARKQLDAQRAEQDEHVQPPADVTDGEVSRQSDTDKPAPPKPKTRYYGQVQLDSMRANRDMGQIVEEVIQHLTSLKGAKVEITLNISGRLPDGFDESVVRTVSENSETLKFDEHGFEEI